MAAIYDSKPGLSFQSRIDSIQKYSELSISLAQTHNLPGLMASSQNELASLYRLNNLDLDRAEKYGESAFANFIGAGMYRNAMNNSIVLSDIFLRKKMYRKALDPCYQVVDLIPIEQNEDMYLRVYLQLAKVYSLLGEYKTAYDFLSVGRLLEKLVTESQTDSHIAEMSAKYSLEIKETQIAHSKQAIEDQKKNTRQLIFIFLLISVTLLFILLYLWTKKKIDLQKHLLDKAEKQNLQMLYEKKSLELKLKNQELVQTLAGNINRTNALKTIKQNVIAGKNPNEIVKVINLNIDTEQNWKKVMLDFQRMYPNFLPALKQQHPELTRNEKRLSVLLFLDITSAEIASILSVSESAISKGRQRLRHKLKLDPSADLGNYFKSFS
jgi:DNA-binding CsgD family transcriptional regulator